MNNERLLWTQSLDGRYHTASTVHSFLLHLIRLQHTSHSVHHLVCTMSFFQLQTQILYEIFTSFDKVVLVAVSSPLRIPCSFFFITGGVVNEWQTVGAVFYVTVWEEGKPRACTVGMLSSQPVRSCSEPLLFTGAAQKLFSSTQPFLLLYIIRSWFDYSKVIIGKKWTDSVEVIC